MHRELVAQRAFAVVKRSCTKNFLRVSIKVSMRDSHNNLRRETCTYRFGLLLRKKLRGLFAL